MKVFIAGGTGAIGRVLVPRLIRDGHEVVAISRTLTGCEAMRAQGATAVQCDVFDVNLLSKIFGHQKPDAVINQLTSIPDDMHPRSIRQDMYATNQLRVEGTRRLLQAAERAGTKKFITQSIAFAYAPIGGDAATEETPLYRNAPASFATMIGAIRRLEDQVLNAANIVGSVLRYGYFYGPGTIFARGGSFANGVYRRRIPVVGDGSGRYSFVHVDDAASATVQALNRNTAGIFNICDDEPARVSDWLPYYAELLGAKPPRTVPAVLGRLAGGSYLLYLMLQQRGASNFLAKWELGWKPRYSSWRDGFNEELAT